MTIRPARLQDCDAILAVQRRNGLVAQTRGEWLHVWGENPFAARLSNIPIGWVIEDEGGQIVGALGNVPLLYEWNSQPVRAAATRGWAVDPLHRNHSLQLIVKFFAQKNVDLLLDSTANPVADKVFLAFKAQRLPQVDYDKVLLWVTGCVGLAGSVLRQRGIGGAAFFLKYPFGMGLWGWRLLHPSSRPRRWPPLVRLVEDFDERFDGFWSHVCRRPNRLLAVRNRQALQWHFGNAQQRRTLFILVLEQGGELAGYAVVVRNDNQEIGLRRLLVADLQVPEDRPADVQSLLQAVLCLGRDQGVHAVEMIGFNAFKRQAAAGLSPMRRAMSCYPFYYKAVSPMLQLALADVNAWDASPFDGDATL